jgi:hypothetical protein
MHASLSVRFQFGWALIDLGVTPDNRPFAAADPGSQSVSSAPSAASRLPYSCAGVWTV